MSARPRARGYNILAPPESPSAEQHTPTSTTTTSTRSRLFGGGEEEAPSRLSGARNIGGGGGGAEEAAPRWSRDDGPSTRVSTHGYVRRTGVINPPRYRPRGPEEFEEEEVEPPQEEVDPRSIPLRFRPKSRSKAATTRLRDEEHPLYRTSASSIGSKEVGEVERNAVNYGVRGHFSAAPAGSKAFRTAPMNHTQPKRSPTSTRPVYGNTRLYRM